MYYKVIMGAFVKTVFGSNGVVRNAVDIATIPLLTALKKKEVVNIERKYTELLDSYKHIDDETHLFASMQKEIQCLEKAIKTIESEIEQLLSSDVKDTNAIAVKNAELHKKTEETILLKDKMALKLCLYEQIKNEFDDKRREIESKLLLARMQVLELEEKLDKARGK